MSSCRHAVAVLCLSLVGLLAGCGEGGGLETVPTDQCASGKKWTGGDSESALMHPGGDCIDCHSRKDGPRFVVAGTVAASRRDADDCAGVEGADVIITDANQKTYTLKTNEAGNFFLHAGDAQGFALPFTARVSYQGTVRDMVTPQSSGACASCHTVAGTGGAPGRVNVQ
ncbi:hypothetical protein [Myxococcus sp. RHSTA-1-4]|uniref:hypothetical protein n=1 Tax=Myxococcus sp. RHSTA-1-4 TaxID=2874601 RepID=UPI001CC06383|nr:hypothetical protein [Myxococcus sp. RHSTA-1-4]MBZ4418473.1 hypothetical protein [Myxococcus sp. RHSTA-1-4]